VDPAVGAVAEEAERVRGLSTLKAAVAKRRQGAREEGPAAREERLLRAGKRLVSANGAAGGAV
jgi:hypothetical protein